MTTAKQKGGKMNQLINIFKMLSDENRLRIIMLLYKEELCVCQLEGILKISQPRISQNLSKLRDLNLVEDERREKFVFYSLKKEHKLLLNLLENIEEKITSYPVLVDDLARLQGKDSYLSVCRGQPK